MPTTRQHTLTIGGPSQEIEQFFTISWAFFQSAQPFRQSPMLFDQAQTPINDWNIGP